MATVKEDLWTTLEHLNNEQFKHFQWFLKQNNILDGFSAIPEARLEGADRQDTVDRMVQKYGSTEAMEVTVKILEKISRNDLVRRLSTAKLGGKLKESRRMIKRNQSCKLNDFYVPDLDLKSLKSECEKKKAEIKLMIQERQMKILEFKHSAELSRKSADRQREDAVQIFTAVRRSVEGILANLIEAIAEKQQTTQKQADEFIQELETEISELSKRRTEVEQLSRIQDPYKFLQSCSSGDTITPTKNWEEVSIPPPSYGRSVGSAATQLKQELSKDIERLLAKAKLNRVQQFAVDVTLDPDTANHHLVLSDDGKQVFCGGEKQNLPDKPERFNTTINVLGKQNFSTGRFYYEVQVEGMTSWDLGVVKESVNRKGSITPKPESGYWTICLRSGNKYKASSVYLSVTTPPKKVGVFVDYDNGSVSFYDAHSAEPLHSFTNCSFTENLYPFFSPGLYHSGNPTPLIITSV